MLAISVGSQRKAVGPCTLEWLGDGVSWEKVVHSVVCVHWSEGTGVRDLEFQSVSCIKDTDEHP
jgi:hypothetical protein